LTLRAATEADVPALLALQHDLYAHEHLEHDPASAAPLMRKLIAEAHLGRLLVIEDEGAIAGYMAIVFGFSMEFGGRSALLDELYVLPHARSRGLGTAALHFAEQMCNAEDVKVLQLEVSRMNVRANALYTRSGFVDRGNLLLSKRSL
jgi:ribosomal protein S18 acetylase RimI-like enzyme